MKITAALLRDSHQPFAVEQLDLDDRLGPDQVLVRIVATGLCHTDLSVRDQHMPSTFPVLLGHEGAGVVEAVGAGVAKVKPGDGVVLTPASCHRCTNCLSGHPSYCETGMALNLPGARADGEFELHDCEGHTVSGGFFGQSSFATYAVTVQANVVPVADDLPLELLGPLGCGLQTGAGTVLNVLHPRPGESIAIFGTGPVGLAAVMAARAAGCTSVIAIDVNEQRLALALELGATHTINSREGPAAEKINESVAGGVHYAVDTTGRSDVIDQALGSLRIMGRCALLAIPSTPTVEIAWARLMRGISIQYVFEGDSVPDVLIPQLLSLYRAGMFPFDKMVTYYPLEQINQAVADFEKGNVIKAVLRMPKYHD